MLRRALPPLALLVVACHRAPSVAPRAEDTQRVACWTLSRGEQLELHSAPRGAPEPLELRVVPTSRGRLGDCWTSAQRPRTRLADAGERAPAPLRFAWEAVRDWRPGFRAAFGERDSTRWVDSLAPRLALRGVDGDLAIVPLPRRTDVPDSARVVLTSGARSLAVVLSAAEAWWLGWSLAEQANVHDPDGTFDPRADLHAPQVERPVRVVPASACARPFQRNFIPRAQQETYEVAFVVDTTGAVDPQGIEFLQFRSALAPTNPRRYQLALLTCLGDVQFRPAMLRGQAVRMRVLKEFRVSTGRSGVVIW